MPLDKIIIAGSLALPGLVRVATSTELFNVWHHLAHTMARDLGFAARLALDPIATLRAQGYDVSAEAARVLVSALPESSL
ncbi:MAG: hypothetical protein JNJ59_21790 [Deltaproteobacteria bacterium]|jgi:hypothetical protein|nr:hypothetical protein [Deltaproteobacteria bacterium]